MSATVRTSSRIKARKDRLVAADAESVVGTRKRKNSRDDQTSVAPQSTPSKKSAVVQNVASPSTPSTPSTASSSGEPTTPTTSSSKPANVVPLTSPSTASSTSTMATRSSQRGASAVPKNDEPSKPTSPAKLAAGTSAPHGNAPATAAMSAQDKSGPTSQSSVDSAAQQAAQVVHPTHIFKNPNFTHSGRGGAAVGKKTRTWKTLKQIIASERAQLNRPVGSTYSSIDAPPSRKPPKKYSDISGLPAKYTDPRTKLRYSTTEEFAQLRMLPQDIVNGLLALRRANLDVQ